MENKEKDKSPLERDYGSNLKDALQALKLVEAICSDIHEDTAIACDEVGNKYWQLKEYDKALQYYERSLKIRKEIFGEDSLLAESYFNIGNIYYCQKDFEEALKLYQKALDFASEKYKDKKEFILKFYDVMSLCYNRLSRFEDAIQFSLTTYEIRKLILGEKHDATVRNKSRLIDLYLKASEVLTENKEYDKALEYSLKVYEFRKQILGEKDVDSINALINVGFIYQKMGEYHNALKYGLEVLNFLINEFGEEHPYTITFYGNVGSTYSSLKDNTKALQYFEKALALSIKGGDKEKETEFRERIKEIKQEEASIS